MASSSGARHKRSSGRRSLDFYFGMERAARRISTRSASRRNSSRCRSRSARCAIRTTWRRGRSRRHHGPAARAAMAAVDTHKGRAACASTTIRCWCRDPNAAAKFCCDLGFRISDDPAVEGTDINVGITRRLDARSRTRVQTLCDPGHMPGRARPSLCVCN